MTRFADHFFRVSAWLFVFFLPFQTRWILRDASLNGATWEDGRLSIFVTDALLLVVCLSALALRRQPGSRMYRSPLDAALFGFLLIGLLSTFVAPDTILSWQAFIRLALGIILFFLLVRSRILALDSILAAFVVGASLQAVFAIGQFFAQETFVSTIFGLAAHDPSASGTAVVETASGRFLRAYASFPHPNVLGGYLAVALIILLGFYLRLYAIIRGWFLRHPHTQRRMLDEQSRRDIGWLVVKLVGIVAATVVVSFGLFFSFSRSAWLATAASFAILALLVIIRNEWYRLWVIGKFTAIVAVSILLASPFAPGAAAGRLVASDRLEVRSTEERSAGIVEATKLLERSWHTGVGIGAFTAAVHDDLDRNRPGYDYRPVHSLYLLIATELSAFGLLVFLVILIECLRQFLLWMVRYPETHRTWPLITAAACFSLLVIGFFDHYIWTLPVGIYVFWLTFAAFYRSVSRNTEK